MLLVLLLVRCWYCCLAEAPAASAAAATACRLAACFSALSFSTSRRFSWVAACCSSDCLLPPLPPQRCWNAGDGVHCRCQQTGLRQVAWQRTKKQGLRGEARATETAHKPSLWQHNGACCEGVGCCTPPAPQQSKNGLFKAQRALQGPAHVLPRAARLPNNLRSGDKSWSLHAATAQLKQHATAGA